MFGERPSRRAGIKERAVAFDFDDACTLLLNIYEPSAAVILRHLIEAFKPAAEKLGLFDG
jgi:hypothetical protein